MKAKGINLTPATRVLIKMREGKGAGMLSLEEIELLRQSKREMSEALRHSRESKLSRDDIANSIGILKDKTNKVASLEEIKQAIIDGWAKGKSNQDE